MIIILNKIFSCLMLRKYEPAYCKALIDKITYKDNKVSLIIPSFNLEKVLI